VVPPYTVRGRGQIVVAMSAIIKFHTFHARHYAFAAVFGALALVYNPVASTFIFQATGSALW
jgi:hypothetical protein